MRPADVKVVLVHPRNPLNIGAAARAMSNFDFHELRLVQPYDVAFQEAKSAVNASAVLENALVAPGVAEAIGDCSLVVGTTGDDREPDQPLLRLEAGARKLREHSGPLALLFGSEKYGLSNDDMSHCHWLMRIPSRPEHSSMNLGQAVAVCLYELIREDNPAAPRSKAAGAVLARQSESLVQVLYECLSLSGYYDKTGTSGSERRLRNLIKRMRLSQRDALMVLGMLRQILWRLKARG